MGDAATINRTLGPMDSKLGSIQVTSTTTAQSVIAAPGAGKRLVITDIIVTNDHASTDTEFQILSATTVKIHQFALAGGGGFAHGFTKPLPMGVNEAINAKTLTSVDELHVTIHAYVVSDDERV